jgi:short subunit dehydrogenase-like uncharacterized protein
MTISDNSIWILYGAYGYTGQLTVQEAIAQGLRPVLAGRDRDRLAKLAERYQLPYRAFAVDEGRAHLDDAHLLLNCAGPFSATAEPLIDACLERGVHYLDVTGEIPVFQAAHRRGEAASHTGVVLCPGVGFDIVPTDCLAALLKQALPDATHLEIALAFGTRPSRGTLRTALGHAGDHGLQRRDGKLVRVPIGKHIRKIPFPTGPQWTVSLPWADIYTAYLSTGIPNITTFGSLPWWACQGVRLARPLKFLLARRRMQQLLMSVAQMWLPVGPNDSVRAQSRSGFWGRATTPDGRECCATIQGPSAYSLTAELAVAVTLKVVERGEAGGYFTPSMLVGGDFLSSRDGYVVTVSASDAATTRAQHQ